MDRNIDRNNANSSKTALMSVRDIDVKVENDVPVHQRVIKTKDTMDYNMTDTQSAPLYVAIDGIRFEFDIVNSDKANEEKHITEHTTSSDTVCTSTTTEDDIHGIKTENEDHDVECGSTATKDCVTDDIKVEVIQEIIAPEEFTNIEMMCRSKLLSDVEENCGVMNQDGASETATNTDVKRGDVLIGEDYSPDDSLLLAEKLFSCKICHKVFTKKQDLERHSKKHNGKEPFSCDTCHKAFKKKQYLVQHMITHTGEKPFSCDICHTRFTAKSSLLNHLKIHSGKKSFKCEVCHKRFLYKRYLVSHLRKHSGEKPFKCNVCSKTFSLKGNLVTHMRIHTGEKPYTCVICRKSFSDQSSILRHLKQIHPREEPYTCEVCLLKFNLRSTLVTHMKIHEREKPCTCEVCHITYSQKILLTLHTKTHSGEKPLSCDVCHIELGSPQIDDQPQPAAAVPILANRHLSLRPAACGCTGVAPATPPPAAGMTSLL